MVYIPSNNARAYWFSIPLSTSTCLLTSKDIKWCLTFVLISLSLIVNKIKYSHKCKGHLFFGGFFWLVGHLFLNLRISEDNSFYYLLLGVFIHIAKTFPT